MKKANSLLTKWRCLLLLLLFSSGCMTAGCETRRSFDTGANLIPEYLDEISENQKEQITHKISQDLNQSLHNYRLHPGDILEIIYHFSAAVEDQEYILGVNDEIFIHVYRLPELSQSHVVRPDGKISLPRVGDVRAVNQTPGELAATIHEKYKHILHQPEIVVQVTKFSSRIEDIRHALRNAPRGESKPVTVAPDGYIYLPLLEGIKAQGKTVDELRRDVNTIYQNQFSGFEVSFMLETAAGKKVFIFGEVNHPGMQTIINPMTALQAISLAGGIRPTGAMDNVKILYWDANNHPRVRTVNLYNVINHLQLHEDMVLPNNSVLYVPETGIARANRFVEQYISKLFLYTGAGIGLGFSYELNQ